MIVDRCDQCSRPKHEIADIFRQAGHSFLENFNVSHEQRKVLNRIIVCRTAALGGHIDFCTNCDHQQNAYNSCRNRHCPKCQTMTKERWLISRQSELLPATYYHLVFTLPYDLNPVIVPGGVLSDDRTTWTPSKKNYLFKTRSLVKAFKGIYIKGLKQLYEACDLKLPNQIL